MAAKPKRSLWLTFGILAGIGILVFIVLQILPIGGKPTNPPVLAEPNWNSPQTRALAVRACFDCHSNQTVWPWYSYIAPVSWLVTKDAIEGRQKLNFSEWGKGRSGRAQIDEVVDLIQSGEMPLPIYLSMHPEANLSAAEKQQLIDGLKATLK